ncbi:MAG: hypothetical protein ACKOSS_10500 [Planctomycetia bacterium]
MAAAARRRDGERGIALLIVLLLVLIIAPFAEHYARQVGLEARTARNVVDQLAIENAIDGQFELVLARLEQDATEDEVDSLYDTMFDESIQERQERDTEVSLSTRVFDESGKFNVLNLVRAPAGERREAMRERLVRLLVLARQDSKEAIDETLARELVDDAIGFLSGKKARGQIPKPSTPDSRGFLLLEDLAFANPKWGPLLSDQRDADDVAPGLARYLTVYGPGKVNLNTADLVVLRAFFPSDETIAERIVERREGEEEDDGKDGASKDTGKDAGKDTSGEQAKQGNPFTDVNQVNQVEGVTPLLLQKDKVDLSGDFDVKSAFWSMRIMAETQSTRREELYVVERVKAAQQGSQAPTLEGFRHLLHQERTDALEDISKD